MASLMDSAVKDNPILEDPPVKTKATRRRGKRDGPIQLQFVTATDPSQFKDDAAKRSVRSQAMIHYRNKGGYEKKTPLQHTEKAPVREGSMTAECLGPLVKHGDVFEAKLGLGMPEAIEGLQESHPTILWRAAGPNPGRSSNTALLGCYVLTSRPRDGDMHTRKALSKTSGNVVKHEYKEDQVEVKMRILAAKTATFYQIGDGVDPFDMLPQFKSRELDITLLTRSCMRTFWTQRSLIKWLSAMFSHPHVLLSSTVLASGWLDMHSGCPGDSRQTALVKAEILGMISERLRHPNERFTDSTLLVILNLLGGEIWSCNEKTLRTHESGIARFVAQRGGLHCFGPIAETCAAVCYHCDIFCEAEPLPTLQTWEPSEYLEVDENVTIPESPLFCPRSDFVTASDESHCSASTRDLLRDMRDLTDLFIAHNAEKSTYNIGEMNAASPDSLDIEHVPKITEIRERLTQLPSAYIPGLATSNDWVYEACRITALIYTASIILRLPFSITADPNHNPLVAESEAFNNPENGTPLFTTRLSEALYEILKRTDLAYLWGNMSGVFYWVTSVGAAAARAPAAIDTSHQPQFPSEAYAVWVRRCLTMYSMRAMTILIFEHPIPVLLSQKRLLRVQKLIGTYERELM